MSDAEAKLATFWRADRPRSPDAAFRLAVMERRAHQRFRVATTWILVAGVCAASLIALLVPIMPVWAPSQSALTALEMISIVVTCASIMWAFMRGRFAF